MKFPWVRCGDGVGRPLIRCGLRRLGVTIPADMFVLLDTGADSTILPFSLASMLGFSTADLEGVETNAVGGKVRNWRPRGEPKVEIQISGTWYMLPGVLFAENTPALLGRDIIFREFKLRMEDGETDLRPR